MALEDSYPRTIRYIRVVSSTSSRVLYCVFLFGAVAVVASKRVLYCCVRSSISRLLYCLLVSSLYRRCMSRDQLRCFVRWKLCTVARSFAVYLYSSTCSTRLLWLRSKRCLLWNQLRSKRSFPCTVARGFAVLLLGSSS